MEVVGNPHLKSAKFSGKTGVGMGSTSGTKLRQRRNCNRDKGSEVEFSIPGICMAFNAMLNLAQMKKR